jgi:hypothetical protein
MYIHAIKFLKKIIPKLKDCELINMEIVTKIFIIIYRRKKLYFPRKGNKLSSLL